VLSVAGNASKQFAIGVITDTGESWQKIELLIADLTSKVSNAGLTCLITIHNA